MANTPNVAKKKGNNKPKVELRWGGTISDNPHRHQLGETPTKT